MDYTSWIDRERRVRTRILRTSVRDSDPSYRVCLDCREVCLCHEEECPNCGSRKTSFEQLSEAHLEGRIRCRKRFEMLEKVERD